MANTKTEIEQALRSFIWEETLFDDWGQIDRDLKRRSVIAQDQPGVTIRMGERGEGVEMETTFIYDCCVNVITKVTLTNIEVCVPHDYYNDEDEGEQMADEIICEHVEQVVEQMTGLSVTTVTRHYEPGTEIYTARLNTPISVSMSEADLNRIKERNLVAA